jgi:hypothetical protein
MMLTLKVALFFIILTSASGCGYTMQTSQSNLKDEEGIESIYIEPFQNDTYKAGIENTVYNAFLRTVSSGRRVRIVKEKEQADAIVRGKVTAAQSTPGAAVPADRLLPVGTGPKGFFVAIEYNATLSVQFELVRLVDKKTLWTSSFTRARSYPGNNQLGVRGTTSQLINESEFDRALGEMAEQMMGEVHESMLARF